MQWPFHSVFVIHLAKRINAHVFNPVNVHLSYSALAFAVNGVGASLIHLGFAVLLQLSTRWQLLHSRERT